MTNIGIGVPITVLSISIVVSYILVMNFNATDIMARNGLLFVSNATKIYNFSLKASKYVNKVLYIKVNGNTEGALPVISKQIVNVYSKAISHSNNIDIRLILQSSETMKKIRTHYPIDMILYDSELLSEVETLKESIITLNKNFQLQSIESEDPVPDTDINAQAVKSYEYVAVGGTFDRLHNGHKILLSEAVLRAKKQLIVGVTDVNMIQSKKLWELIEPVEKRIRTVLNFLTDINPNLEYNVLPIQDMYGPTKDDPRIQLLIVSEETSRAVAKINDKRKENGLPLLDSYTINLAEDMNPKRSHEEEVKISSSNQRMRLLGTILKPPVPNPNIPDWPYVIGLTGGIASGKSNIAEKLKAKGAVIINCDLIAHELYVPGTPLNSTIAEVFGKHVITETGEVDRRKLGQIVFSDKEQLERLNELVWPAVIAEAERRVRLAGGRGCVAVLEAAVMLRAHWYTRTHQLWAVLVPPVEAIKRLQQRNGLSEEEARQRVEAQPSNQEQVAHANIVFSPYWSYEYTQGQIDRAWEHLQEYLQTRM